MDDFWKGYIVATVGVLGGGVAIDVLVKPAEREMGAAYESVTRALVTRGDLNENVMLSFNHVGLLDGYEVINERIVINRVTTADLGQGLQRICANYTVDTGRMLDSHENACVTMPSRAP